MTRFRLWPVVLVLGVLLSPGAVLATPSSKKVVVDCQGRSHPRTINEALQTEADHLVVLFSGVCAEQVVILRDNVELQGVDDDATIAPEMGHAIALDGVSRVVLRGFRAVGGKDGSSIRICESSLVEAVGIRADGADEHGVYVARSDVTFTDCSFTGNTLDGLSMWRGSRVYLDGELEFNENDRNGILVSESNLGPMPDADAEPVVVAHDNGHAGAWVQVNGVLKLTALQADSNLFGATAAAHGVLTIPLDFVATSNVYGLLVATRGHATVGATISDSAVGVNVFSGGSVRLAGEVTGNQYGVSIEDGVADILDLACEDNTAVGVYLSDAATSFQNVVVQNSGLDIYAEFGSRMRSRGTNIVGSVVCDSTVLSLGDVSCPAPAAAGSTPVRFAVTRPVVQRPMMEALSPTGDTDRK